MQIKAVAYVLTLMETDLMILIAEVRTVMILILMSVLPALILFVMELTATVQALLMTNMCHLELTVE